MTRDSGMDGHCAGPHAFASGRRTSEVAPRKPTLMQAQTQAPRIGIDAYLDWIAKEGLPVGTGLAIDMFELETADWPRLGVKGAVAHLDGRGDYCNMFKIELPPGKSTTPQKHVFEEVMYVLEGRGSTQVEFPDGSRRSFEWGPRSLFAIPLNTKYRHFNGSGTERALLTSTTNLPIVMKMFHNERFVFDLDFDFDERAGKDSYFQGEGDLYMVRPGNNYWETNFVPNLGTLDLPRWDDRGKGSSMINFILADGSMHAHISEMPVGTYKKAHRHPAGTHVVCVAGNGYSLLWFEGEREYKRVDWKHGTVFPPANRQLHQHFTTSREPARYLGIALGSLRYPITEQMWMAQIGKPGEKQSSSKSIKEGGDQVEWEDQDPHIHELYVAELKRIGITPAMDHAFPS
jgi:quercetin dioxygenase-like cupin family protein